MKKLIKGAVTTLAFVFTLFVCGVAKVGAAELKPSIENTSVAEGSAVMFTTAEDTYYVTTDGAIKFVAKSNSKIGVTPLTTVVYWAEFSVVKCTEFTDVCRKWSVYDHTPEGKKTDSIVMDNLKAGLSINLTELELTETDASEINRKRLGELSSVYDMTNTYFVIVHYYQSNFKLGEKDDYTPEVFKVVLRSDLEDLTAHHSTSGNVAKFTIKSGTPISTIRYFASPTKLTEGYDYAAKFTENVGVEVVTQPSANPVAYNGTFSYEFDVTMEEGKYYYVEATDVTGATVVYDVSESKAVNTEQKAQDDSNVGNTNIGKIILIALLVLLVISIVLVIVQKIVDHRRKLY